MPQRHCPSQRLTQFARLVGGGDILADGALLMDREHAVDDELRSGEKEDVLNLLWFFSRQINCLFVFQSPSV